MLPATAVASASAPAKSMNTDKVSIASKPAPGPEYLCKRSFISTRSMNQITNPATNPFQNPFREKRWGLGWGGSQLMYCQALPMTPLTNANGTLSTNATGISLLTIRETLNQHKNPKASPNKNLLREKRW